MIIWLMDKSEIIQKVASVFHEKWRENRLMNNEKYKPMIEKSEDKEWNMKHWTEVVDIANTEFEDLPSNRKHENFEAAKVVVDLVYDKVVNWEEVDSEMIEEMSKIVHEKWLERNWVQWSFENQRVDYVNLSEEEKAKDRIQVELAVQIVKSEM